LRSYFQVSDRSIFRDRDGFAPSTWQGHVKFYENVSHLTVHSFALHGKGKLTRFYSIKIGVKTVCPSDFTLGCLFDLFIETKRWVGLLEDSHNKVLGHQHHITTYFSN
jgi:hypothetical protein